MLFSEEINKKTAQSAFPDALSQFSKQVLVPKASVGVYILPPVVAFLLISMAAEHLCYRLQRDLALGSFIHKKRVLLARSGTDEGYMKHTRAEQLALP